MFYLSTISCFLAAVFFVMSYSFGATEPELGLYLIGCIFAGLGIVPALYEAFCPPEVCSKGKRLPKPTKRESFQEGFAKLSKEDRRMIQEDHYRELLLSTLKEEPHLALPTKDRETRRHHR